MSTVCWFCVRTFPYHRIEASVVCKCNRGVCDKHSKRKGEQFLCLECALEDSGSLFEVAYKQLRTLANNPLYTCSCCGKKYLHEWIVDQQGTLWESLDPAEKERLKLKLSQAGIIMGNGKECPNNHGFCKDHPTSVRRYVKNRFPSGVGRGKRVVKMGSEEVAEYDCPVCHATWVLTLQVLDEGKSEWVSQCHEG